uniref:Mitogen-activated protein kinase n=1 Tax=Chromera velia CCMP2878 TaxID=1169474 RepID=A0A0G4GVI8_9ALVE|eukprot:Cvel_23551.t1-p1 / transcript=Cvel_23551.t1 / gene=Cvel_23551 / organism=Chromera_velia_CCMP2878 / gene_product=Mitogen-activated protein kinase 4, putative / transcript_product=Mitogen-activated protein kinase 4, putative / location=Cvel_scaffold2440:468-6691(-) / protein_length=523 / sequence_SO=supercontig / SO=protein_coding / is_pseudo=false
MLDRQNGQDHAARTAGAPYGRYGQLSDGNDTVQNTAAGMDTAGYAPPAPTHHDVSMAPQPPRNRHSTWEVPDRYEIKQLIGTGSYGSVAESCDLLTGGIVAIKRIHRVFEDLVDCKRILREIALLNRLDHMNVVKILDICVPQRMDKFDELYIVLEIADSDFKKLFRAHVHLSELHVKTLLYNLLLGVRYVHARGILHRDLKPANCLVNQDCTVKICDFGLARTISSGESSGLPDSPRASVEVSTAAAAAAAAASGGSTNGVAPMSIDASDGGAVAGDGGDRSPSPDFPKGRPVKRQLTGHVVTRWYRAPELILLQENYGEAIDVWSIGCVFAELMNMIKENVQFHSDRGPLFPGSSCFPLSPDHRHTTDYRFHSRGNRDQLNMIFSVIGTPCGEDVEALEKEDARRYIRLFEPRPSQSLAARFPASSPSAVDLLSQMLIFSASKRITLERALRHAFLAEVRSPEKESLGQSGQLKVSLPFNDWEPLSEPQLRYCLLREIARHHPEILPSLPPPPPGFRYREE